MYSKKSPKYQAARDRLPEDLQGIYDDFVEQYAFLTITRYGRGYVAYDVLADLILEGWRRVDVQDSNAEDIR